MNFFKRLFTRKPSIYDLRQKYFDKFAPKIVLDAVDVTEYMERADKIANWVLYGRRSTDASSSNRGRGQIGND